MNVKLDGKKITSRLPKKERKQHLPTNFFYDPFYEKSSCIFFEAPQYISFDILEL
eukprot:MONOS_3494.1-p1 / transcript=MONOS_3494.1 / gene=MONOS_3494 / organism=Monocercomonoides_exilis_PA203 / gene_product=unspecified product / transcript_product=unspecified product / location=Mono_scaffold00082:134365-134650(+) / protein_length=54 / sequence_SO=supercontig / SO=protein_coding / is_pseudo=false